MKRHTTTVLVTVALVSLASVPALGLVGTTDGGGADRAEHVAMNAAQTQGNETFEPIRIESETMSFAGVTVSVENALVSVERGTPTVWFKRVIVADEQEEQTWTLRNGMIALSNAAGFAQRVGELQETDVRAGTEETVARNLLREASAVGARVWIGSVELESPTERRTVENVRFTRSFGDAVGAAPPAPSAADVDQSTFTVSELDAPTNVSTTGSYNVSATVTNPANANGTEEVQYRIDDRRLGRQLVQLGPGESRTVTFEVSGGQLPISQGTTTHGVYAFDDHQTAAVTVSNATANQSAGLAVPTA